MLRSPAVALVFIQLDLLRALPVGRVGHRIVAIALLFSRRSLIHGFVLRRIDHYIVLAVRLVGVIGPGSQKQQAAADPHFSRIGRQAAHAHAIGRRHHDITRALRAIPVALRIEIVLAAVRNARITARYAIYRVARSILRAGAPAIAAPVGTSFPVVIRTAVTGLPVAVVAAWDVLVIALSRWLGLPCLFRTALDRQVVLSLAQLLTLLVLLLLNLALLIALLLLDLLLLLALDVALLNLLLLDLLLLLTLDLTLLILLFLNLTLLVVLLLIDLLLLLTLDLALLVLLLLDLALLVLLLLDLALLIILLLSTLLLLLTLLSVFAGAAVKLIAR